MISEDEVRATVRGKVRLARTERGETQEELSVALDVHKLTVTKWETGAVGVSLSQVIQLANHFGKPVAWFFEDAPSQPVGLPTLPEGSPIPAPAHFEHAHPAAGLEALQIGETSVDILLEKIEIAQAALTELTQQLGRSNRPTVRQKKAK